MKKRSKRYKKAAGLVTAGKTYPLPEAVALVKQFPAPKFDQSVTISFKMGVDPRKSDQMVRGTCALPHGSGKKVRVAVFAQGVAAEAARAAGAELVGFEDLIEKIKGGFLDFDTAIATPDAMAEVRKLARVLGPRGLMPNPKTGTVTDDTAKAVNAVMGGQVTFKLDRNGNISVPMGKVSFEPQKLVDNARAVIEAVVRAKPATAKGNYLQAATLAATMTPGVSVEAGELAH
ncbi:MAG: 50S ribosomal protein L1 [Verrucomicrobiales bacterium]